MTTLYLLLALLGALVRHWAIQPPPSLSVAGRLSEPAEVALVAAVLGLGVVVGSVAWTIGI